ncbi:MAG: HAMP domain-containing histidine kinase [Kiritimatiellales bacterium]|nr:HAMP domain-containing histidine kinase [Kiritimatiellales bacterium]MCF7864806.1 HAMP domain-containing histidine kinase [Kiritimatiellales bacterium]
MNVRLPRLLYAGLLALVAGLFVVTFLLNRNQYEASISSVESSFNAALDQQAKILRDEIAQQEENWFAHHQTTTELDADLFIVMRNSVVPSCIAGLLATVPAQEADKAFKQGIATLPNPDALPFFEQAAKRVVETPDDLYRKISAYFNMLELDNKVQTVCCILTLLDLSNVSLPESQTAFFNTLLEEQVPDLGIIKARTSSLWKTARRIDQKLKRQKGAYRAVIDGQTLSVNENGLALLYSPDIQATPPILVTNAVPEGLHEEIVPGWMAYIPGAVIAESKQKIRKQYRTGNAILALMIVLGGLLGGGIAITSKRQRELNAMKTEFIATVSHELRTPLSLIRLHAESLCHERIPPEKIGQYHRTILTETERLSGIVNNVLDFSRMERNKLQIHLESTDLSVLCEHILDSFHFRLEQDGFALERQIAPGIVTHADPLAFSQIVFNLLDNAIKYSDEEKRIRIELERSAGQIILRISDWGIGIPDKLKKRIFDDFVRSDDSKVTARRGSGIGLSVARRLAGEMGGAIEVADNQPKGSVFTATVKGNDEAAGG